MLARSRGTALLSPTQLTAYPHPRRRRPGGGRGGLALAQARAVLQMSTFKANLTTLGITTVAHLPAGLTTEDE